MRQNPITDSLFSGYAAMAVSRTDYFGGVPFPLVLPVASIGTKKFRVMASYIPRISNSKSDFSLFHR
jgi:lipid IVA palmitoyltransferase